MFIQGRGPSLTRVTAMIKALQIRAETVESINVFGPDSSCSFLALSTARLWLGLPNAEGVVTYRYNQITALTIGDPMMASSSHVRLSVGGQDWLINVGSADAAVSLFRDISAYAFWPPESLD